MNAVEPRGDCDFCWAQDRDSSMRRDVKCLDHHSLPCVDIEVFVNQSNTDAPWNFVLDKKRTELLKFAEVIVANMRDVTYMWEIIVSN